MKYAKTLTDFILEEERNFKEATGSFSLLMLYIEQAAKVIASHVGRSGLVDIIGASGYKNQSNDDVQKLDIFANTALTESIRASKQAGLIASEEMESALITNEKNAKYAVFFDPLDGSSNIDVNISIGTIFSIYRMNERALQKGIKQIAAGYIIYGPSIMFVYTCENKVHGFTYDPSIGSFLLSHENIRTPEKGNIYSINEAYYNTFPQYIQKYVQYAKKTDMKLRYVGSMVSDVHRTLLKGGVFMYPQDTRSPDGKLRLMYEVNPMALIMQNAGGMAVCESSSPLLIQPTHLHERQPLLIGSTQNVKDILSFI
ncbi:MAG: class 1 fructose-bisphosphatase [Candidatus Roizmanbacteria bacterium]|nr:class 1 fructose-bisphosphatase [Candidatus Roizmanbacteria bacterium]